IGRIELAENHESLRELIRQLILPQESLADADAAGPRLFPWLASAISRLGESMPTFRPSNLVSAVRGLRLPSLPEGGWGGGLSGRGLPSLSQLLGDQALTTAGWLVFLGGVLAVLWKLASASRGRARSDELQITLGPWPVSPGAVHNREEVAKAF